MKELNPSKEELLKKVCLLGDPGVGKTSLVRRFVHNEFGEEYISTIGTAISTKSVETGNASVELVIWDIAGQETFEDVSASYFPGAEGGIVVCDITRRETFDNLPHWIHRMRQAVADAKFVILLNKSDLTPDNSIDKREVEELLSRYPYPCMLSSARTGASVEEAFSRLCEMMVTGKVDMTHPQLSSIFSERAPSQTRADKSIFVEPSSSKEALAQLAGRGLIGLLIAGPSSKLIPIAKEKGIELLRLNSAEVDPKNLLALSRRVKRALAEGKNVLIDSLDYLLVQNDERMVAEFIRLIAEFSDGKARVILDASSRDSKEIAAAIREVSAKQ